MVATAAGVEPLDQLPDDTIAVLRMASLHKVPAGLNDFLGAIRADAVAGGQSAWNQALGELLHLHGDFRQAGLDAIDPAAPVFVVVVVGDDKLRHAVLLKVRDREALVRSVLQLDRSAPLELSQRNDGWTAYGPASGALLLRPAGSWTFYTRSPEAAAALGAEAPEAAFCRRLDGPAAAQFQQGDVAVAINAEMLVHVYRPQIDAARDAVLQSVQSLPDEAIVGASPAGVRAFYNDIVAMLHAAVLDTRLAVLSAEASASGVGATALIEVKRGSATDRLLAALPPSTLENVGLLPAGLTAYFGLALPPEAMSKWIERFTQFEGGSSPRWPEAAAAMSRKVADAELRATYFGFAFPGAAPTGFRAVSISEARRSDLLRDAYRELYQTLGEIKTEMFVQKFRAQAAAEKYKDQPVDLMWASLQFVGDGELVPIQNGLMKKFYGDELQTRSLAMEGILVSATGNDAAALSRVVDALESGEGVLAAEEAYGKTRDKLAPRASFVALVDGPRMFLDLLNTVKDVPPLDEALRAAPINLALQPPPSYFGLSVGTEPQGLRVQAFFPPQQVRHILQIFGAQP
jgi:hypothetical protein